MLKRIDRIMATTTGTPSAILRMRAAIEALNAAQARLNQVMPTTRTTTPARPRTMADAASETLAVILRRRTAR